MTETPDHTHFIDPHSPKGDPPDPLYWARWQAFNKWQTERVEAGQNLQLFDAYLAGMNYGSLNGPFRQSFVIEKFGLTGAPPTFEFIAECTFKNRETGALLTGEDDGRWSVRYHGEKVFADHASAVDHIQTTLDRLRKAMWSALDA